MVKHIILWTLKPELTASERQVVLTDIKNGLEGLKGVVPGLVDVHVQIANRIDTSNCDLMLDCTLESEAALRAYAIHPAHVEVANTKVRPYTIQRVCLDYAL
ncbi:MAG: Dabb family protein [Paludibacteraceae bacterium]|nr:Dabb family protein [Paludibacteraceae bacterium]